MTAPNGAIKFNTSTGSDTQASGLGPSTAVFGTGGSVSSTAVVTGIVTTGVVAGDLLWLDTASGRQFSIIATVDSGTQVTCDDAFGVTASGLTWAIGGKRATFGDADSQKLFGSSGVKAGWTIETETDQSISATITLSAVTGYVIRGNDTLRTITQTSNLKIFEQSNGATNRFEWLKFVNSNGTKTNAYVVSHVLANTITTFANCIIGDATNKLFSTVYNNSSNSSIFRFVDCIIEQTTSVGYSYVHDGLSIFERTVVRNCGAGGIFVNGSSGGSIRILIDFCLIYNNTGHGLETGAAVAKSYYSIRNSVFYNNSSAGISIPGSMAMMCFRNVFSNNGTYGITQSATNYETLVCGNAFYSNTSGQTNNVTNESAITLTATPFVDASTADFNLNTTAGGGADMRDVLFAGTTNTNIYPFRNWVSDSFGGGLAIVNSRRNTLIGR